MPPSSSPEQTEPEQITLSSGTVAELIEKEGTWALRINGARQSHIGPPGQDPDLTAVRWMLFALGGQLPQSVAHLGGGLLTLPRVIADRRPASRQIVVELEPALVDLARTRFGLPEGLSLHQGDARAWLEENPGQDLDAVVLDVFAGDRIPPAFTSLECFTAARAAMADDGRLVINSVAGPDLLFTRRELATMRSVFEHVAMIVQGSALGGARFGNAALIGSPAPLDIEAIRSSLAGDSSKGALVTDIDPIIDGAQPVTDAEELWSPEPIMPMVESAKRMVEQFKKMEQQVRAIQPDKTPETER